MTKSTDLVVWGVGGVLAAAVVGVGTVFLVAHYQSRLPLQARTLELLAPGERGFGRYHYSYTLQPSDGSEDFSQEWRRFGFFRVRLKHTGGRQVQQPRSP